MDDQRKLVIQNNLINSLKEGDEKARLYAIKELEELFTAASEVNENAVPVLVGALLDYNPEIRTYANQLLQQFDPQWIGSAQAKSAIPSLISNLVSFSKETAIGAFRLLRKFGTHALPDLIERLQSTSDEEMQIKIVQIISQLEGEISDAVPELVRLLKSKNKMVKEAGIRALRQSGSKEKAVLLGLLECLDDPSADIRLAAVKGLGAFENYSSDGYHALVKCLLDTDPRVRIAASEVLIHVGAPAAEKVMELIRDRAILRKQELQRLQQAKGDLFKGVDIDKFLLEPSKAMNNVSWHFEGMSKELRKIDHGILLGIEVLAHIGKDTLAAVEVVKNALKDVDPDIREKAVFALGALASDAEPSLSFLPAIYQDSDFNNYELLVQSLNNIDPDWSTREEGQSFLIFLLNRLEGNQQKLEVLLALRAMKPETLKQFTTSEQAPTRFQKEVVELLVMLGDNAKDALPYLNVMIEKEENAIADKSSNQKRIGFNRD